jgi:hypothetical protein
VDVLGKDTKELVRLPEVIQAAKDLIVANERGDGAPVAKEVKSEGGDTLVIKIVRPD